MSERTGLARLALALVLAGCGGAPPPEAPAPSGLWSPAVALHLAVLHRGAVAEQLEFATCLLGSRRPLRVLDVAVVRVLDRTRFGVRFERDCGPRYVGIAHSHISGTSSFPDWGAGCYLSPQDHMTFERDSLALLDAVTCSDGEHVRLVYRIKGASQDKEWRP